MQKASTSSRITSININDIIGVLRIGTQNQYNARELHTTVSWIFFLKEFLIVFYFLYKKNATVELNVTSLFGQDYEYQV